MEGADTGSGTGAGVETGVGVEIGPYLTFETPLHPSSSILTPRVVVDIDPELKVETMSPDAELWFPFSGVLEAYWLCNGSRFDLKPKEEEVDGRQTQLSWPTLATHTVINLIWPDGLKPSPHFPVRIVVTFMKPLSVDPFTHCIVAVGKAELRGGEPALRTCPTLTSSIVPLQAKHQTAVEASLKYTSGLLTGALKQIEHCNSVATMTTNKAEKPHTTFTAPFAAAFNVRSTDNTLDASRQSTHTASIVLPFMHALYGLQVVLNEHFPLYQVVAMDVVLSDSIVAPLNKTDDQVWECESFTLETPLITFGTKYLPSIRITFKEGDGDPDGSMVEAHASVLGRGIVFTDQTLKLLADVPFLTQRLTVAGVVHDDPESGKGDKLYLGYYGFSVRMKRSVMDLAVVSEW